MGNYDTVRKRKAIERKAIERKAIERKVIERKVIERNVNGYSLALAYLFAVQKSLGKQSMHSKGFHL